jgi:hypothetical protein
VSSALRCSSVRWRPPAVRVHICRSTKGAKKFAVFGCWAISTRTTRLPDGIVVGTCSRIVAQRVVPVVKYVFEQIDDGNGVEGFEDVSSFAGDAA